MAGRYHMGADVHRHGYLAIYRPCLAGGAGSAPRPHGPRAARGGRAPGGTGARRKRYKVRAELTLPPAADGSTAAGLPGPVFQAVVRARHHETRCSHLFTAFLTTDDEDPLPGSGSITATVVALGYEPQDCLAIGDDFALWRGSYLARGVVTRRAFT